MEIKTLLKSNIKSHRETALGVFVLILLVSLSLGTVLTVWNNSSRYVNSEMNRLGYGDITAWVSGLPDAAPLTEEISALDEVESVGVQSLIFSEYEIGDLEVFENVAYMFAKHADPSGVPDTIEDWLDEFQTFSIYLILPQILELWGFNQMQMAESKKKIRELTGN